MEKTRLPWLNGNYLALLMIVLDFIYYYQLKESPYYYPSLIYHSLFLFWQVVIWFIIFLITTSKTSERDEKGPPEQTIITKNNQIDSKDLPELYNSKQSQITPFIFKISKVRKSLAILCIVLLFFSYGATYKYSSPAPKAKDLIEGHTDFHPVFVFKISDNSYGIVANRWSFSGDLYLMRGSYFLTIDNAKIKSQEYLSNGTLNYLGQISGKAYFQDMGVFSSFDLPVHKILVLDIDQSLFSSEIYVNTREIAHQMEIQFGINGTDISIDIHFLNSMIVNETLFVILRYSTNSISPLGPETYLIKRYDNGNLTDFFQTDKAVAGIRILDDHNVVLLESDAYLSELVRYSQNMTQISVIEISSAYSTRFCGDLICSGGNLFDLNNTLVYASGHDQIDSVLDAGDRTYIIGSGYPHDYVQIVERDTYAKIYEFKVDLSEYHSAFVDNQLIVDNYVYSSSIQALKVSYFLQFTISILSWIATIFCIIVLIILFDPRR